MVIYVWWCHCQISSKSSVNKMTVENLAATVGVNLIRKSEGIDGELCDTLDSLMIIRLLIFRLLCITGISMQRVEREKRVVLDLLKLPGLFAEGDNR